MEKSKPAGEWEEVRQELHQMVDGVINRISQRTGYQKNGHFPTFDEREELASSLGGEIASYLLEKSLIADPELIKILQAEVCACPKCQTLSKRVKTKKNKGQEETIMVKTKVGQVPVPSPLFRCDKCRRNFSPLERFIKP